MPNSEPPPVKRKYVVTSNRCVWGDPGEEIELELTEGQEKSLLDAGTVERAKPPVPAKKATTANNKRS